MVTFTQVSELVAQMGGLAIFAGSLAAVAAFVYRWYVREEIPRGLPLLVGLSGVAVYLNTTTALGQVIGGSSAPTQTVEALFNIVAFLAGAGGATLGQWVGDRSGTELFSGKGLADVESDVGRLVQSVGRVIAVELPSNIDDVVGYDPVPAETKETLAGKTFLFPRRLTVDELHDRLVTRLKTDYGVGHVDIELAADGTVEYLALGSRAAGIGPTLPPATNAVVIRADPAFAASAGDLVQVWETDPMRRVLTAELRGVAEDTVTIAIDAADTQKIDPSREYRLVTLPVEDRPDREFASLLRAADETFSSVTVEAGSPLHGLPIAALDLAIVGVKPESGAPNALPAPSTVLAPGDVVYAIARPDALRRLEAAATPLDPSLVSGPSSPSQRSRQSDVDTTAANATADYPAESSGTAESDTTDDTAQTDEAAADGTDTEQPSEPTDVGEEMETSDFDPPAAEDPDETAKSDDTADMAGKADESSFQQLKEEFESGDADWAESDAASGDQSASGDSAESSESDSDGLDGALAEAGEDLDELSNGEDVDDGDDREFEDGEDDLNGLSFGAESGEGNDGVTDDDSLDFEDDDGDLDSLSFDDDEGDDDLSSLSFDEDDEGLSLDDENEAADEDDDDEDSDGDGAEDDDDDDGGSGGASSFQQLKEEFESGDADWEDDISDSPGGDMRLDE